MRRLLAGLFALAALAAGMARGQNAVQEFSGTGGMTTPKFTVGDRWEVRWNARQAISVAAMSANGTIVAGASGVLRGSLFVPAGGRYFLKITDGTGAPPAPAAYAAPMASTNAVSPYGTIMSATNASPVVSTNAVPAPATNVVPEPAMIVPTIDAPAEVPASWHVEVMQLSRTVASTNTLTVYTPYFTMPDAIVAPFTPQAPPPPPMLTQDQVNSLVTIKGDNAQGHGFLVRSPDGVSVVAHLRLLAANPNLQIFSSSGAAIKIVSMKAATDRNLVLIRVQDDHLKCLPSPGHGATAPAVGDQVIIPAIDQANPTAGRLGRIVSMSPDRIDFDAEVDLSSNSAPVIDLASGQALGIVTAEKSVDLTEETAKAWTENPAPGSARITPYFGLALGNVAGWENLDLAAFDRESGLLKQFHDTTRCLDSFLNGRLRLPDQPAAASTGPPDSRSFTSNAQISAAAATFKGLAGDADTEEVLEATRELLDDLQTVAKTDVDALRGLSPVYSINRRRMQEELDYRKAIQTQLDGYSDETTRLSKIALRR